MKTLNNKKIICMYIFIFFEFDIENQEIKAKKGDVISLIYWLMS